MVGEISLMRSIIFFLKFFLDLKQKVVELKEIKNSVAKFFVPTRFIGTWVHRNYGDYILQGFRSQNVKIFPASVGSVMDRIVWHLRCVIPDHPFNDPTYTAVGFGPRGIKGSVEFYNRCTNSKPIIHIETVYNENKDKLADQIDISEYGGVC